MPPMPRPQRFIAVLLLSCVVQPALAQPTTAPGTLQTTQMRPRPVFLTVTTWDPARVSGGEGLMGMQARLASGALIDVDRAEIRMTTDGERMEPRLVLGVKISGVADPSSVPTEQIAPALVEEIRNLLKPYASLSAQERAERLKKVDADDTELARKMATIQALAKAQGEPTSVLADKVKELKARLLALRTDRMAREARIMALTEGLQKEKRQADDRRAGDPIASELEKLLKLREEDVQRTKQLNAKGLVSNEEVRKAEDAVSETRIRMSEREAALTKSGKGELLDRLSDELAMVTIDMTDLKIQESMIRNQLQNYDAATLDEAHLAELIKQDPDVGAAEANRRPPLLDELRKKQIALARERFCLTVRDVEWGK